MSVFNSNDDWKNKNKWYNQDSYRGFAILIVIVIIIGIVTGLVASLMNAFFYFIFKGV